MLCRRLTGIHAGIVGDRGIQSAPVRAALVPSSAWYLLDFPPAIGAIDLYSLVNTAILTGKRWG